MIMWRVGCTSIVERVSNMADRETRKQRKLTKRQQQKRKLITLGVEVLCLFLLLGVLYVWNMVSKITFNDLVDAGVNEDLSQETLETLSKYTNIAIFGLDNRSKGNYDWGNSDVIMIASINNETKEVKLVSVYRDTYLSVGDGKFKKANSAYAYGGAEQAVQMLNSNLDLNIGEYVCVDWNAVIEAVDALGGVEIDVTSAEVEYINMYVHDMSEEIGSDPTQISSSGKQTLNGAQATAYARIRYTAGDDYKRSSRQRIVLEAMLNKAKQADVATLIDICNTVFDDISTSLDLATIVELVGYVSDFEIVSTTGFPFKMTWKDLSGGGAVVPISLENNVSSLHEYLFGTKNYEPSKSVQYISDAIMEKTGVDENATSIDVSDYNDTAGEDGTN